jgi:hypothetical protein
MRFEPSAYIISLFFRSRSRIVGKQFLADFSKDIIRRRTKRTYGSLQTLTASLSLIDDKAQMEHENVCMLKTSSPHSYKAICMQILELFLSIF